jgi:type III secretion protein V
MTHILRKDALLALLACGTVGLVVFPLPTPLLDGLLSAQLGLSVLLLLTALGVRHPLQLSQFPTLLLLTTLFRLALNVSTTRLILADADAGTVVAAFGDVVVAGDVLVGAVIFAVITLVQFLVISKGAERVAQVSARFALDGLPGRQLAIDADLRTGLLDPETARARRRALDRESSLYGAMDGAMKFVRGDAIAGLSIVAINVVGGLVIGVVRQDLPIEEALALYTTLTVGDGLLTQLPAVLTATAAALVVTRVASPEADNAADALFGELFGDRRALLGTAALLTVLGLLPGLPTAPLLVVGLGLGAFALRQKPTVEGAPRARSHGLPPISPVGLTLHPEAARALAPHSPADIITRASQRLAEEYGVTLTAPRLTVDAPDLPPGGYRIEVAEVTLDRGELVPGSVFACPGPFGQGRAGRHPSQSAPGRWLDGDTPGLSPAAYLEAHLVAVWRRSGAAVMGVQATATALARVEEHHPALVRAVVPRVLPLPRLARLLQRLLAEDVPVRDLTGILEALAPLDATPADPVATVRRALCAAITHRVAPEGQLEAMFAVQNVERELRIGAPPPDLADGVLEQLDEALAGHPRAVWIVAPDLREAARALVAPTLPGLAVLTADELLPGARITTLTLIEA